MKNIKSASISLLAIFCSAAPQISWAASGPASGPVLESLRSASPTELAETQSVQPVAAYSESYQELIANNDGSTTIVEPYFKNPTGEGSLPIGALDSSLDGVCRLYGFGQSRASQQNGDYARTATISAAGKLSGYRLFGSRFNPRIVQIICSPGVRLVPATPTAQARAEAIYSNDDGSVTLVRPFLQGPDKSKIWISHAHSDRNGVCAYFGLGTYAASASAGDESVTAVINSAASVSGFRYFGSRYNQRVDSIVCAR